MNTGFRAAMTAALIAAMALPAMALTHPRSVLHHRAQAKLTQQMTSQVTVNDASTGEGEGDASGAPTGLSGQIATGNLAADAARDNNPSNGTATNVGPANM